MVKSLRLCLAGAVVALLAAAVIVGSGTSATAEAGTNLIIAGRVDSAGNSIDANGDSIDGLWLYNGSGDNPSPIADNAYAFTSIRWHPAGTAFAYSPPKYGANGQPLPARIVMHNIADGAERTVVEMQGGINEFAISPRGDRVAFIYTWEDATTRVVALDGSGHEQFVGPGSGLSAQAWSPDGRHLIGNCTGEGRCFLLMDVHAGTSTEIPLPPGAVLWAPAWSPVGDVIAVPADNGDVILMTPTGTVIRRLPGPTFDPAVDVGADVHTARHLWSPGGDYIVGTDWIGDYLHKTRRMYLWDVGATTKPKLLLEVPDGDHLRPSSWTADGSSVAFERWTNGQGSGIGTLHVGTAAVSYLGPGRTPMTQPSRAVYWANAAEGTVYRLYRAYFLREPDADGYRFWLTQFRNGYPITSIANDFAKSAEFQSEYGNLQGGDFVRLVYQNVLERQPDQAGYNYWVDQMNQGMPRGNVMINFSDSNEFKAKTADGVPAGYLAGYTAN